MLDSGKKIQNIMFDVYYHDQHAPTVLKRVKILKYSIFEIFNIKYLKITLPNVECKRTSEKDIHIYIEVQRCHMKIKHLKILIV